MRPSLRNAYQTTEKAVSLYLGGQVEVYCNELTACAFVGKSQKPAFNYRFKSNDERDAYVLKFVARVKEHLESKAKYKEQKKQARANAAAEFKAALKPGVILSDSWGYEQTNVEFYLVLSVQGATVEIVEIGHTNLEACSWASCYVLPNIESRIGTPIKKRVCGGGIKICSSITLTLWDGKQCYKSWYA